MPQWGVPLGEWSPLNLDSALLTWIRADLDLNIDGSNYMLGWADQSGNARHFTAGASGKRAVHVASGQGGRPYFHSDGVNDVCYQANIDPGIAQPIDVFIIGRLFLSVAEGVAGRVFSNNGGSPFTAIAISYVDFRIAAGNSCTNNLGITDTFDIWRMHFAGANSFLQRGDTVLVAGTQNAGTNAFPGIFLFADSVIGGHPSQNEIYELLITGALTTTQLSALKSYFYRRYSLGASRHQPAQLFDVGLYDGFGSLLPSANGQYALLLRESISHSGDPSRLVLYKHSPDVYTWGDRHEVYANPSPGRPDNLDFRPAVGGVIGSTIFLFFARANAVAQVAVTNGTGDIADNGTDATLTDDTKDFSALGITTDMVVKVDGIDYLVVAVAPGDDVTKLTIQDVTGGYSGLTGSRYYAILSVFKVDVGFIKSTDGGLTWSDVTTLVGNQIMVRPFGAIIPTSDGDTYLMFGYGNIGVGIIKTIDAGVTWVFTDTYAASDSFNEACGSYIGSGQIIAFLRPVTANAGFLSMIKSDDDGDTWSEPVETILGSVTESPQDGAVSPFTLYDSVSGDLVISWHDRTAGKMMMAKVNAQALFDAEDPDLVLAGSEIVVDGLGFDPVENVGGYPWVVKVGNNSWNVVYCKEKSNTVADIYGGVVRL